MWEGYLPPEVGPGDTAVLGGTGPGLQCSHLGTRSCPSTMGVSPICAPQAHLHHLPRFPTAGTGSAQAQTTLGTAGWPAPCPSGLTTGTSLSTAQPSVRTYVLTGAHAPGAKASCIPVPRAGKHIVGHDVAASCPKVEEGGFMHRTGCTHTDLPKSTQTGQDQAPLHQGGGRDPPPTPPSPTGLTLPQPFPPAPAQAGSSRGCLVALPFPPFVKDRDPGRPGRTARNGAPPVAPRSLQAQKPSV